MMTAPTGVAADARGNVYVADRVNRRIRRIAPNGIITTIAGNGHRGFSGDGHRATRARLWFPEGVAVDRADTVYIADNANYRIRKITNRSPRARFVARGRAGTKTVVFNARRSRDPGVLLIAYAWNFGDHHSAHGRGARHTFAHAGRYTVTLTITDDSGMTVTASHRIRVVT